MAHGHSKNLPLRNGIGHYGHEGMASKNIFPRPSFHVEQSKDFARQPLTGPSSPIAGGL